MRKIKASELWEEVKKVAAEQPDFTYRAPNGSDCVYGNNGEPSCIAGHGFVRLGLDIETLAKFDKEEETVTGIFRSFPDILEADSVLALERLTRAQRWQDHGTPWGVAIDNANIGIEVPGW